MTESWLTTNWRPITMLALVGTVVGSLVFGYEVPSRMWDIIEFSLGGYVVGRTVEKIAPPISQAFTKGQ